MRADYEAGRFTAYRRYETSYGVVLASIEDAIRFGNVHEGLHLGYMMVQRRAVG
ncbi:MAG: hypothetical protein D6722_16080 [Bacteroidetes bacterium]|nr:MAG: hypothetical protein D6722_16080 [Bacteroidota bacterium]